MARIHERRAAPKVKENVASFLMALDVESILQIAMMCDAAQEELDLLLASNKLLMW